jgi:hypothetical protein
VSGKTGHGKADVSTGHVLFREGKVCTEAAEDKALLWQSCSYAGTLQHLLSMCWPHAAVQVFGEKDFETFMRNDNEILRSAHARWMLLSERDPTCETVDATSTIEAKGIYIEQAPLSVGTAAAAAGNGNGAAAVLDLVVAGANVAAEHARVWRDEAGDCWVQDLPGSTGTWINGKLLHKGDKARLLPQVRPACCLRQVTAAAQLENDLVARFVNLGKVQLASVLGKEPAAVSSAWHLATVQTSLFACSPVSCCLLVCCSCAVLFAGSC